MLHLIGVDLGVHKVGLATFIDSDLIDAYAYTADPVSRDLQLGQLAGFVHDSALMHEAASVWIEDTLVGNNQKYSLQLTEVKGAVMAALSRMRPGLDVQLVNNKTWKKHIVGNGNATKDMARDYIVDTHPAYAPLCGDDQDLYDACCVGLYGLEVTERATHLQL